MKTFVKLFFVVACISLLFSCQKSDEFSDELSGVDLKSAANCGDVIVIHPSGGDDTEAFIDAFEEAKESGPGTTVQLIEGTYTIGMIEIRDFNGCFIGAGKDKSFISNLPQLPCGEMLINNDNIPYLMQFVGGNVNISEMAFRLNDGKPCADNPIYESIWSFTLASVLILTDFTQAYMPENRQIKAVVKNVDFIAGKWEGHTNHFGTSCNMNMTIYGGATFMYGTGKEPLNNGQISVIGCNFDKSLVGPDFSGFGENSVIDIENNVMIENAYGMFMLCNLGSRISVKNNKFRDGIFFGLWIDDNDWGYYPNIVIQQQTDWTIANNDFQSSGDINVYVSDYRRTVHPEEGLAQKYDIKGNAFNTSEGETAIWGINSKNAKIWNNKFLGTGAVGVMIDGDEPTGTYAENNQIIGNNYFGATYTDASVYLGQFSKNCKVVGVKSDLVVDMGVNNSVIGTKANKKGVQSAHFMALKGKPFHPKMK